MPFRDPYRNRFSNSTSIIFADIELQDHFIFPCLPDLEDPSSFTFETGSEFKIVKIIYLQSLLRKRLQIVIEGAKQAASFAKSVFTTESQWLTARNLLNEKFNESIFKIHQQYKNELEIILNTEYQKTVFSDTSLILEKWLTKQRRSPLPQTELALCYATNLSPPALRKAIQATALKMRINLSYVGAN